MKIELCVLGQISEKRIEVLIDQKNEIVPKYLCNPSDAPSKFMMIQYNAAAAVSENATLSIPANAFSVPTASGLEDINSMAPINARQASEILENVKFIISGEFVCAAKALEFVKDKGTLSKSTKKILIKLGSISDVNKSLALAQKLISNRCFCLEKNQE
jgi:histidine ammonia-lyase